MRSFFEPPHPLRIGGVRAFEIIERARAIAEAEVHDRQVERQHLATERPSS